MSQGWRSHGATTWPASDAGGVVARLHVEGPFRSGVPSVTDAVGCGPTELGHPIQHVAREERFGLPPSGRSGSQTRSDDRFVPKDRVLHARLPMVSRRLLPPPTAEGLYSPDRSIANTGPGPASRQPTPSA